MRYLLAAILALGISGFFLTGARADVVYQWITTSATGNAGSFAPSLVVTDSAISAGGINFMVHCAGLGNCPVSGDDIGFVSINYPFIESVSPPNFGCCDILDVGISFDPDGTLTGGMSISTEETTFMVGGGEYNWSGTLSSDGTLCFLGCTIAGYWEVPEPTSLTFPIIAFLGIYFSRRRYLMRT